MVPLLVLTTVPGGSAKSQFRVTTLPLSVLWSWKLQATFKVQLGGVNAAVGEVLGGGSE